MVKRAVLFLFVVMLSVSFSALAVVPLGANAFAEEEAPITTFQLEDGCDVEVAFQNLNLRYGGVERSFLITVDSNYSLPKSEIINPIFNLKTDALMNIYQTFSMMGYETEYNEYGQVKVIMSNYSSYTDMYIDLGMDGYTKDENEDDGTEYSQSSNLFYVVSSTTMPTVFEGLNEKVNDRIGQNKTDISTYTDLIAYIVAELLSGGVSKYGILLKYEYGTPYRKAITSSGEVSYDSTLGLNIHSFSFNLSNTDEKITITQKNPNTIGWYAIAIAAGLAVVLIPTLIALSKRRKDRA